MLREGFTTGTTATAALVAALELMFSGNASSSLSVPIPPFPENLPSISQDKLKWANLPLYQAAYGPAPGSNIRIDRKAILTHAAVIKNGGDDPDVTTGLPIYVTLIAYPSLDARHPFTQEIIKIKGGKGVGIVTKPGLAIPPGEAAINPVPKQQLLVAASLFLNKLSLNNPAILKYELEAVISVPDGEKIARHTLNPKLGIEGGISILGTSGLVRPYSNNAWAKTIRQQINFAKTCGLKKICFSGGRQSEKYLKKLYPQLSPYAYVQAADMVAMSLTLARIAGFNQIIWGCLFGKMCKLAQGSTNTHAHKKNLNLDFLVKICQSENASCIREIERCNTAREALDFLAREQAYGNIIDKALHLAKTNMERFARQPIRIHLFDYDGQEIASI